MLIYDMLGQSFENTSMDKFTMETFDDLIFKALEA